MSDGEKELYIPLFSTNNLGTIVCKSFHLSSRINVAI